MATEEQLTVRFRDCECPGSPHNGADGADDGDRVTMRQHLGFVAGAEALRMMGEATIIVAVTGGGEDGTEPILDTSRVNELLGPVYIREGVASWNLVDEDGPTDYDAEVILGNYSWGWPIIERADELYSEVITRPLAQRMNALSKSGPTDRQTRQTRRSSKPVRSPRRSSLPNGSAGQPSPTGP